MTPPLKSFVFMFDNVFFCLTIVGIFFHSVPTIKPVFKHFSYSVKHFSHFVSPRIRIPITIYFPIFSKIINYGSIKEHFSDECAVIPNNNGSVHFVTLHIRIDDDSCVSVMYNLYCVSFHAYFTTERITLCFYLTRSYEN